MNDSDSNQIESNDFDLIFQKDLANIIAKVNNGQPLNARERKLLEDEKRKVSSPKPRKTSFEATASKVKVSRTGYFHEYSYYADFYKSSERTIKRWVAIGKSNSDPAPLDSVNDLYAWWSRNMTQKCPDQIVSLLVAAPVVISPEAELLEVPKESIEEEQEQIQEAEKGIEAMLNRLQEIEVLLSRKARDPGGAKPWLDTIARITSVITKLREENEKFGKLIPREMAEMAIHEYHAPIQNGVRGMGAEFCRNAGLPWTSYQEEVWQKCCDALFSSFTEEVFGGI